MKQFIKLRYCENLWKEFWKGGGGDNMEVSFLAC